MNKLKTTDIGGFPLRLDDFRWIDDAQREAFLGTIKTLIGDATAAILYGCIIVDTEQGDVWTCTEGYVFFNNEIYYVPAHNLVHPTGYLYFIEDVSYQTPEGLKPFENLVTHETYEVRRAILNSGITLPLNTMIWYTDDFITIFKARLNLYQPPAPTGWAQVLLTSANVTIVTGVFSAVSGKLGYKVVGKTAHVVIELDCTILTAGSMLLIALPSVLKLVKNHFFTTIISNHLIHNVDVALPDPLYRLLAWNDETHLVISSLYTDISMVTGVYQLKGEITFEIK